MFERYWNFTSCVHCDNLASIAEAITHLLTQEEGCHLTNHLPQLTIDGEQLRNLRIWERPRVWIVGLCSGKDGWIIIKTWPVELFCQRAKDASRPRLSNLAGKLGCDAFHYRVVRDICGILLEANAAGSTFLSGWNDYEGVNNEDEMHWFYDEQINATEEISQFSLLEVSESIQAAMRVYQAPEVLAKEAEYEQILKEKSYSQLPVELINEVSKGYAERIDSALSEVIDSTKSWWFINDLLYHAYARELPQVERPIDPAHADEINPLTEKPYREGEYDLVSKLTKQQIKTLTQLIAPEPPPQLLEGLEVQLLYFQPPVTYNPTPPTIKFSSESLSENEEDDSF